jgi:alkanesulfonate monooxygenase
MYVSKESMQEQVEVFSTCPQSSGTSPEMYRQQVIDVARWSEQCGCKGILVYSDNSLVDPWLISQIIIENTDRICPLVAVQPIYTHPYTVAKMLATLGFLSKRRVYLNMVAGGFKNDLTALNDTTPHDKRYARLVEYTTIIQRLLAGPGLVNFEGEFYKVENLRMTPSLDPELLPGVFVSGSSEAGLEAARVLGATAVQYPKPAKECEAENRVDGLKCGVRVGIIARENDEMAWDVAEQRFPEDRKGQLTHQLAMKVSDSMWHKQLTDMADHTRGQRHPYWLRPFENYKTFCPYLVGNHERVAEEIRRYIAIGYRTFILDVPPSFEELRQIGIVFERAVKIPVA